MRGPRSSRANPDLGKNFDYNMEILETGPLDASKEFYGARNNVKPKVFEEPVCQQALQNHLPIKKNKPAQQKYLEDPMVPLVVSPGYILSKNKSKYHAMIKTGEFFNPIQAEDTEENKEPENPERDILLEKLHQQIADLKLFLEEERYKHMQSKVKAEQFLNDTVKELQTQHQDEISKIEEEHTRVIKEIEENHRNQFENCKQEMESQIGERLENEKESEIDNLMKEHREQEEQLKKEHGEKLESMAQYYYNVMEELKEMNSLKHKLKNTQMELEFLKDSHADLQKHFNKMNKEFTNTRGQLKAFEDNFDKKVDEVDDHYKLKINNLLMMNSELRKTFRKKCEELATEKYCASQRQEVNIKKIKDTIESCRQKKTEIPNIPGFQIPSQSADKEVAVETTTDSAKDYHQLLDKDFFKCTDIVKSLN
ncbi:reticulocyte-binding protein 2 homolog a-like isoform X2 [Octopus sinensis]|uniref:Reticulocyte-binding protein 2 homolog a-like isoform X2 n=1 Tax=Octopus sinensis TaxID=2607531 RepID=A0A7E6FCK0_9MOLL|nr:reticulocyte-binding protein 2 homolog a-like isoform X2 [Octopus sinensis]